MGIVRLPEAKSNGCHEANAFERAEGDDPATLDTPIRRAMPRPIGALKRHSPGRHERIRGAGRTPGAGGAHGFAPRASRRPAQGWTAAGHRNRRDHLYVDT